MALEQRRPSLLSRFARWAIVGIYKRAGWTAIGSVPEPRRFVLVAAPHTSNWDFLYFMGLTEELGIMPYFMAKKPLFRWPWKNFLLDMGGVPVDRKSSHNYVEQMIEEFGRRKEFILTVAPEGTRRTVEYWKTGFYHIAMGAGVPLVLGVVDYRKKSGGIGPTIWPTGDYRADMKKLFDFYRDVIAKNPRPGGLRILEEEGALTDA
ncbi:MAG: lysophospholipid acyltransferase family protein [Sphingorhabdus sp.]